MHVWYCLADDPPWDDVQQSYLSLLSADERSRYDRFMFDKDRRQFLLARSARPHCAFLLCAARSQATGSSPLQPPASRMWPPASACHTCNSTTRTPTRWWPAPSLSTHAVGVDVESLDRQVHLGIARHCLSADRTAAVRTHRCPSTNWRSCCGSGHLKEAYSKALGLGLSLHFVNISFAFDAARRPPWLRTTRPSDDPHQWQFHQQLIDGRHYLAVAVQCPVRSPAADSSSAVGMPLPGSHLRLTPRCVAEQWTGAEHR